MRKEVLFAILAGITLGLILAFGVWRANLALRSKNSPETRENQSSVTSESSFGMTLATPVDFEVISESPLTISGITQPNLIVTITTPEEDFVVTSGAEGEFGQDIALSEGVNEILITAYDGTGGKIEKKVYIAYSTEFAKQVEDVLPSPTQAENEASPGASEVREKVQEKVSEARKVPKFVMGSVTDKLTETIEIRDFEGQIKQISLIPDTAVFVKITKTKTEVKFSDLAIGDFIVAMGFQNGNGVLDGRRILITEKFESSGREAIMGTVASLKRAEFTLKSVNSGEEFLVKDTKELTILSQLSEEDEEISLSDLEEGQRVIAFGVKEGAKLTARTVVVEQSPTL